RLLCCGSAARMVDDQVNRKQRLRRCAVEIENAEVLVWSHEERHHGTAVNNSGRRANGNPRGTAISRLLERNGLRASCLVRLNGNIYPEAAIMRRCPRPEGYRRIEENNRLCVARESGTRSEGGG